MSETGSCPPQPPQEACLSEGDGWGVLGPQQTLLGRFWGCRVGHSTAGRNPRRGRHYRCRAVTQTPAAASARCWRPEGKNVREARLVRSSPGWAPRPVPKQLGKREPNRTVVGAARPGEGVPLCSSRGNEPAVTENAAVAVVGGRLPFGHLAGAGASGHSASSRRAWGLDAARPLSGLFRSPSWFRVVAESRKAFNRLGALPSQRPPCHRGSPGAPSRVPVCACSPAPRWRVCLCFGNIRERHLLSASRLPRRRRRLRRGGRRDCGVRILAASSLE